MNPKKLARKVLPRRGVRLAEETYRKGRVYSLQALNLFPARGLRVIGVTGTNGKTTTCNFINEMLKNAGYKTALYSTAIIEIDSQKRLNESHRTVPLTAELIGFFKDAAKAKVDFVVMEVTSMALDQHKMIGIPVEVAVMTNLSQEHLDYHGTMENYAAAKARLFNKYMHPKYAVLNRDEQWYEYFAGQASGEVISYGKDQASSVRIVNISPTTNGSDFSLEIDGKNLDAHSQLVGEFNVYNAAAAAAAGLAIGLDNQQITSGIATLKGVPGRMEKIEAGQDFEVIIDYAVTPDALAKALQATAQTTKGPPSPPPSLKLRRSRKLPPSQVLRRTRRLGRAGRVIVVFGATGDRDKSKRPLMGEVAAKYADRIFLTDDETYSEDPAAIRRAVYEGILAAGGATKTTEIGDRRRAIKAAFNDAKPGDTVLLTGIGHQTTRNMGGHEEPWNEHEVAKELLSQLTKT
ncbi:UDP-N-acetylmuramoyl-L-alanyl-D-glutamate--2,6-diaminopimelate ligase [Candidatus Saccharibacteria bacterium]|nr:UDP-N-acetylmuramoyl-L-alanyl-D-glutamate--2,6-diaminopimelate ligase [Candidatus Saccharibacteria bacterium]